MIQMFQKNEEHQLWAKLGFGDEAQVVGWYEGKDSPSLYLTLSIPLSVSLFQSLISGSSLPPTPKKEVSGIDYGHNGHHDQWTKKLRPIFHKNC